MAKLVEAGALGQKTGAGFYKKEGLNVQLNKTAGWALIRDKMLNKEHDASHFLSPMPIAISMGIGSASQAMRVRSPRYLAAVALGVGTPLSQLDVGVDLELFNRTNYRVRL